MIGETKVTALVPARGGSKGLPGKNLARIGGHSLIARAVMQARESRYVDHVVASTDDHDLAEEARRAGADVPFMRPAEFASDEATMRDVALHALGALSLNDGYLVLLQPTSPLRLPRDIDDCLEACAAANAPACVTVQEVDKTPYWMYRRSDEGVLSSFVDAAELPTRRQDAPSVFLLNGCVYVVDIARFLTAPDFVPTGSVSCVMPLDRSVDIDNAADLDRAERMIDMQAEAN